MDYDSLRREAIAITQNISGKKWTDYNIHDPGVTILEQFVFVLTDIAYRTNIDIEELLFHRKNLLSYEKSGLFPADQIFPSSPITLSDFRILFLDQFVDILSNCWFEKLTNHREGIKGLFNLVVQLKPIISESQHHDIKRQLRGYYLQFRNFCEDIEEIIILKPEPLQIELELEVTQESLVEEIIAELLFKIEQYLNPWVEFKSLEELEEIGLGLEEIFNVPSNQHGFILKSQLRPKQDQYYISKIQEFISVIPGVRHLQHLRVFQNGVPVHGDIIHVSPDKFITLLGSDDNREVSERFRIKVHKGGVANKFRKESVNQLVDLKNFRYKRNYEILKSHQRKFNARLTTSEIENYESIQTGFPAVYGVGSYTPAKEEGAQRLAQSSQLKAYLIFFDQIMANHLAQLSHIGELLSIDDFNIEEFSTYYAQSLYGNVTDAEKLIHKTLRPLKEIEDAIKDLRGFDEIQMDRTRHQIRSLERELARKRELVVMLANENLDRLLQKSQEAFKQDKSFNDLMIYKLADELRNREKDDIQKNSKGPKNGELRTKVIELIEAELFQREHKVEMADEDLTDLMIGTDNRMDRKNRVLSHLLARFGDQFTSDFQSMFYQNVDQRTSDNDKKLIQLKSTFLKQIVRINRFRSRGVLIGNDESYSGTQTELETKVSLLLNLEVGDKKSKQEVLTDQLTVERLTTADVKKKKNSGSQVEYLIRKSSDKQNKVEFLVNSPQYVKYLFQFGLMKSNYQIIEEGKVFGVYFIPPTHEDATRLYEAKSKNEARQIVEKLVNELQRISNEYERFRVVEHILLRPHSSSYCNFLLKGANGSSIFRSSAVARENIQVSKAHDALLLACYKDSYQVVKNSDGDYNVLIKNSVGVEIAHSCDLFLTELSSEKFIQSSVAHFTKSRGDFNRLFELDNKLKYYFEVLDEMDSVMFSSIVAKDLEQQESLIEKLFSLAVIESNYRISENRRTHQLQVEILEQDNQVLVIAQETFRTEPEAQRFIDNSANEFRNWRESRPKDQIVRYRREGGRSSSEYNSTLSVVFPDWTSRFHNMEFVDVFKNTVLRCAPAHVSVRFVPLSYTEMFDFEQKFDHLISELAEININNRERIGELSNSILKIISDGEN